MKTLFPLAALAALALSACSSHNDAATADNAAEGNTSAAAAPVKLPPMMTGSKTYRCDDSSIVYVDYFADNITAHVKTDKDGAPTTLTAPEAGKSYAAEGYSLTGTVDAPTVKIAVPGKKEQSCKA